jgi:hypothetical protein
MSESLFNTQNILKYTFRFLHMAPVVALSGKIIFYYLFPPDNLKETEGSKIFSIICSIILIIAGLVNYFLL